MQCSKCLQIVNEDSRYCEFCGERLTSSLTGDHYIAQDENFILNLIKKWKVWIFASLLLLLIIVAAVNVQSANTLEQLNGIWEFTTSDDGSSPGGVTYYWCIDPSGAGTFSYGLDSAGSSIATRFGLRDDGRAAESINDVDLSCDAAVIGNQLMLKDKNGVQGTERYRFRLVDGKLYVRFEGKHAETKLGTRLAEFPVEPDYTSKFIGNWQGRFVGVDADDNTYCFLECLRDGSGANGQVSFSNEMVGRVKIFSNSPEALYLDGTRFSVQLQGSSLRFNIEYDEIHYYRVGFGDYFYFYKD